MPGDPVGLVDDARDALRRPAGGSAWRGRRSARARRSSPAPRRGSRRGFRRRRPGSLYMSPGASASPRGPTATIVPEVPSMARARMRDGSIAREHGRERLPGRGPPDRGVAVVRAEIRHGGARLGSERAGRIHRHGAHAGRADVDADDERDPLPSSLWGGAGGGVLGAHGTPHPAASRLPSPHKGERVRGCAGGMGKRSSASQRPKSSRSPAERCRPCLVRRSRMSSAVAAHSSPIR